MDPDAADWFASNDDTPDTAAGAVGDTSGGSDNNTSFSGSIPTGPPVPDPYAHILKPPAKEREFMHWARNKHLQYKYINEYSKVYYDDCVDYLDKRILGIPRDPPRPQEWAERSLRLYAKDGERLTADEYKYWYTTANNKKPRHQVFHAVHSKDYYNRQYKSILC